MEHIAAVLEHHGLLVGLLAVFVGGLALNLTPCVYPMIPVTLAFFSAQAPGAPARTVRLALIYVIGLSLSYAVLGVIAAQTGALLGSWLQRPFILVAVAAVIVGLSLSMFGLYELRAPQWVLGRAGRASAGAGGALTMGLMMGLIAAPCIGPFVLGLFLFVSRMGQPLTGLLIFFVLGLGMGLPYILLALGANSAGRLPKAGPWLLWCKQALGLALWGLALYFLRPLLGPRVVIWGAAGLLIGSGLYLGWLERAARHGRVFPWLRRLAGIVLIALGVAFVAPRPSHRPSLAWEPFHEAALRQAQAGGQPVLIDVYADWCLPCLELDHVTFRHPDVVRALAGARTMRLDVTRQVPPEGESFIDAHQIYGVPTVLLFDAQGTERRDLRITGFVNPKEFLERWRRLTGGPS